MGSAVANIAKENADFWTEHNVTFHHQFSSAQESLDYLYWRNSMYYNYESLMPFTGHDGKIVLDYGCGPGHDLVGLGHYSKPKTLIGIDVSASSLREAKSRLSLHQIPVELLFLSPDETILPLEDESVDYINCSGVLHHLPQPEKTLAEFKRVLKKDGEIRMMVYNYHSIWMHLYVVYMKQIIENFHKEEESRKVFSRLSDGGCPIARIYSVKEFIQFSEQCGLQCELLGVAVSASEVELLPTRFKAIMDLRLPTEQREFLTALTFDEKQLPLYQGIHAGLDGCYVLKKV